MNNELILLKIEMLRKAYENLHKIRNASVQETNALWKIGEQTSEKYHALCAIIAKLNHNMRYILWAMHNMHTEEGIEIFNQFCKLESEPEYVTVVLDRDDAFMDERYGND